ncbi:HVA22-like protein a isoform X2 [Vitis riparia]|uniref:HVA22-like protein a isoform X2 n=1 Tax=Vitis riparia TaxID=96939 RepID=UPI00155AE6F9|nr:HVA22-like protein a isoform X2 [Vitis riparia]
MGSGTGNFLKVVLKNIDVLAGPVVSLAYPLLPFWPYAKLIATCWLVIPYFSGAAYVYEHFVRPLFVNPRTVNIWYVPRKKDVFSKPDDILTAAEKYIQENGPDAFENIINRVDRESKSRGSNYAIF